MKDADEGLMRSGGETREIDAAGNSLRSRIVPLCIDKLQDTPPRVRLLREPKAEKCAEQRKKRPTAGDSSHSSARHRGRRVIFRQKIIGRTLVRSGSSGVWSGGSFGSKNGAFELLHQPAGEHGCRVFFHPLIQQGTNLFSQIRCEIEPREFIALERVAGGGEKKLPRGLGTVFGQGDLRTCLLQRYENQNSTENGGVTSNCVVMGLWKSVENMENALKACSGCAGDYENPDWSAWECDPDGDEEVNRGGVEEIDWAVDEAGEG